MRLRSALLLFSFGTFGSFAQDAGDLLFDTDQVIEMRFTFPTESFWFELLINHNQSDTITVPAGLTITDLSGTHTFDSVAVRLKGNSSYDFYPTDKKPMKIDFNDLVDGQAYHGLKKLNLNNGWSDPTFLREKVFFDACRGEGVLAPRMSFANVFLNDIPWGFYGVIEQVDKTYLDHWLGDNDGNLFKAGDNYTADGGGIGQEADLEYYGATSASYTGRYELKTNETENDWSDLIELLDFIDNTPTSQFIAELPERMELGTLLRSLALDNLYGNMDAYYGSARNYYLYHDSISLKWNWIHWDANMAFGRYVPQWVSNVATLPATYTSSGRRLLQRVFNSSPLRQAYMVEYCDLFQRFSNAEMDPRIDALRDLIQPHVIGSVNMEYQDFYFAQNIEQTVTAQSGQTWNTIPGLKSFISERRASLLNSLNCAFVGVDEILVDKVFQVAPNPTRDRITLSLPGGASPTRVALFDATGRSMPVQADQLTVDLSSLPSGLYLLVVDTHDEQFRANVMKE